MKPSVFLAAFAFTLATLPLAQAADTEPSTTPVAYVYVSSPSPTSYGLIYAYSASSDGQLTLLGTEPSYASYMALNQGWLFGTDGTNIYSFSIAADGSLSQTSAINATHFNPYNSGGPGNLFLDHSGATLYDGDIYAYGTGSNAYQAFSIDQSSGQLSFLQLGPDGGEIQGSPMTFTGTNLYTYSSGCYEGSPGIYGYRRNSDGSLTQLNINPAIPTAPPGENYCPYLAASDPNNHLAVSMTPVEFVTVVGPPQLAVYSQSSDGNLTTTSTTASMPKTLVTTVIDLRMSPSGKLLAVAGTSGLQVFHFNGAKPITRYTQLLTTDQVNQVFWDNADHLYALSPSTGHLHVFTVTPTTHSEAPGSPYTVTSPQNLIVLPKS
jgi:hypothetical protein